MALVALATVADLEVRLGRPLAAAETMQAGALLDDASATVRTYTGRDFTAATTTERLAVVDGKVHLPQIPVTAVTAVKNTDGGVVSFTWHHGNIVHLWAGSFDYTPIGRPYVDVTYTHGTAEVPDAIVSVVCSIAKRALEVPGDSSGLAQESIGAYSYAIGSVAASGGSGLLNPEKMVLDRFRRVGGTVWTGGR